MEGDKPSVSIIGTGALGSTLQHFFEENGYRIRSVWNSRGGKVYSNKSGQFKEKRATLPEKEGEAGDFVFITTPDDLISKTARDLAGKPIHWKEKVIIHCSGNLTSDELTSLSEEGAKIVSMHPIQSFKKGDGRDRFRDITISLQGDKAGKELLKPIIGEMGANALMLNKKQKRYLHIAAVMASNYLVALMFSVENLLTDVDLEEGFESLQPLVHQTVTNIFEKGPADALTGPISRGDTASVQKHLKELKGAEQEVLYKIMGLEAAKIAERGSHIPQEKINMLRNLFTHSLDQSEKI
ncbi:MAG: DUF2520 domain-containing protein [Balneolaceae bacterium]|nr:DUF2520 domain-containing protein [Balneolaceae bacterium]MDR9410763.1 DUF2520 domain-containing protein [Balneolaceae bacterium]